MSIKPSTIAAAAAAVLAAALGVSPALAAPAPVAAPATATAAAHSRRDQVVLPDGFRPEGIASIGRTFFSGSLADGRIWRGDLITGTGSVLVPGVPGRSLRGMQVDPRTGLLWVTGNEGATGIVLAVDARTGAVVRRIEVPGAGRRRFAPLPGNWPATQPGRIGANGTRALPGGTLVLNNSTAGGLYTVD